jgi:cell division protein FtsB
MNVTFDINLKDLKNKSVLFYENGKIVCKSLDELLKKEKQEIDKLKTENKNLKTRLDDQDKKIKMQEELIKNFVSIVGGN